MSSADIVYGRRGGRWIGHQPGRLLAEIIDQALADGTWQPVDLSRLFHADTIAAERLLSIEPDVIPPAHRRPDAEIAALYTTARPAVLGALLDLTAEVLGALPGVRLGELPRMADFARVLGAIDQVRGWSTLADYTAAAAAASQAVLDGDPVADAVLASWPNRPCRRAQRASCWPGSKPPSAADEVDALLARTVLAHGLSIALQDPIVLERVAEIVRSARQTQRHARAEPAA